MIKFNARIERESKTIGAMIAIYCHKYHGAGEKLCIECFSLEEYAGLRLQNCPFQEGKTTCAKCTVHFYNPVNREKIRNIMRYSGPRMLYKHPFAAIVHLMDGRRRKPINPNGKTIKARNLDGEV